MRRIILIVVMCPLLCLSSCKYLNKYKKGENELKLAYVMAPGGAVHEGALEFARLVKQNSNGNIKVKIYSNGQLGNDRELNESMILGSVDMIITGPSVIGWYAPKYGIMEAPFIFRSYEHLNNVLDGDIGEEIEERLERSGIHIISYWLRGPRYLTTTNTVIKTPEDLNGLKLRVPELPTYIRSWKVFGANPTPLPYSDMFMALKQGVVDGQENPLEVIYTSHLYETQKYIMETRHLLSFYIVEVGDPFFKKFSEENQGIIFDAARKAGIYQNELMEEYEADYKEKLIKHGTEFIEVDREGFEKLAIEVIPPYFEGKWEDGLFERILVTE
jgi:TRAP-type transport system periplasmic protein